MELAVNTFEYSPAELSSFRLDGEIIGDFLVDSSLDWLDKSQSVLAQENVPMVLTSFAASWALGIGMKPQRPTATVVGPHRLREAQNIEICIEERTLASHHYWIKGKSGVTTPLRTISDLLRCPVQNWFRAKKLVSELITHYQLSIEDIEMFIHERGIIPHKQVALHRVREINYPSDTR